MYHQSQLFLNIDRIGDRCINLHPQYQNSYTHTHTHFNVVGVHWTPHHHRSSIQTRPHQYRTHIANTAVTPLTFCRETLLFTPWMLVAWDPYHVTQGMLLLSLQKQQSVVQVMCRRGRSCDGVRDECIFTVLCGCTSPSFVRLTVKAKEMAELWDVRSRSTNSR